MGSLAQYQAPFLTFFELVHAFYCNIRAYLIQRRAAISRSLKGRLEVKRLPWHGKAQRKTTSISAPGSGEGIGLHSIVVCR